MRLPRLPVLLAVTSLLAIAGCGFELRGVTEIPPELSPMYVQAAPGSQTGHAVRSTLQTNGVPLATGAAQARSIVRIVREEEDERVTAVNSQGKVIGTELQLQVTFEAAGVDGALLAEAQTIKLAREYVNPGVDVLGKTEEALLIRQDMRRDMADRILRRLEAQLLNPP